MGQPQHGEPNGLQLVALADAGANEQTHPLANVHGTMQLRDIGCPKCGHSQKVGNMKLRTSTSFSMIKC